MNSDAPLDLAALEPGQYCTTCRPQEREGRVVMVEYALVPPDVLARLVTCARALRNFSSSVFHVGLPEDTCRACMLERALVGIVDSAQETPHD